MVRVCVDLCFVSFFHVVFLRGGIFSLSCLPSRVSRSLTGRGLAGQADQRGRRGWEASAAFSGKRWSVVFDVPVYNLHVTAMDGGVSSVSE